MISDMNNTIYLDNNATTQVDDRVIESMLPYFTEKFANASSKHEFGVSINARVKTAREKTANLMGAESNEIIFTSGATESINLAIKGIAESYPYKGKHILTTKTEHSAVLDVCKYLERKGFELDYLSVDRDGLIDVNELEEKIREDTIIVSVIYVNNETGVIQPINEIGEICRNKNVFLFTDATQAVGKIPIDVSELNVDMMCFSGHKFYGPKGIGGLLIKQKIKLEPLFHGGGHEGGLRSGTLNVPGIIGLSKAFEIAVNEMQSNEGRIKALRNEFENKLLSTRKVKLNGHPTKRLYNVSNVCLTSIDPFLVNNKLKNIAYSQGSACNSSSILPSHVLKAMGLSDDEAFSSFRFSFGKNNTREEINNVLTSLNAIISSQKIINIP